MAVYRKPITGARIKSDAATLYFNAEIAVVGMANQEVGFPILRLFFLSSQYPPDLKKDDVILWKFVLRARYTFASACDGRSLSCASESSGIIVVIEIFQNTHAVQVQSHMGGRLRLTIKQDRKQLGIATSDHISNFSTPHVLMLYPCAGDE